MKNWAVVAVAVVFAAGLAACSSSGSSGSAASAKPAASVSGTETMYGKLTGPAALTSNPAVAYNPVFHLTFTGPVATTANSAVGRSARKGESLTLKTAAGNLAITFDATGHPSGVLVSTKTCHAVITETVPITVDGAKSTGRFAGASGTGRMTVMASGDLPKLSSGQCLESQNAQLARKTAVATVTATIKLTVRK